MDLEWMQQKRREAYEAMLVEYASGCLDEAHALLMSAHASLCEAARRDIAHYETLGGLMLERQCAPVSMREDALFRVMARLDAGEPPQKRKAPQPESRDPALPRCLTRYTCEERWVVAGPGRHMIAVRTHCTRSEAKIMRLAAGNILIPAPEESTSAILILEGACTDGFERFTRGDVLVMEAETVRPLQADAEGGVTFMLVRERRITPREAFARRILSLLLKR